MMWNGQLYKKCKITTTYLLGLALSQKPELFAKNTIKHTQTHKKILRSTLLFKIWSHGFVCTLYYTKTWIVVFTSTTCNWLTRRFFFRAKSFLKARKRLMYISNFELCIYTHVKYTWYATSTTVKNCLVFWQTHKLMIPFLLNRIWYKLFKDSVSCVHGGNQYMNKY